MLLELKAFNTSIFSLLMSCIFGLAGYAPLILLDCCLALAKVDFAAV